MPHRLATAALSPWAAINEGQPCLINRSKADGPPSANFRHSGRCTEGLWPRCCAHWPAPPERQPEGAAAAADKGPGPAGRRAPGSPHPVRRRSRAAGCGPGRRAPGGGSDTDGSHRPKNPNRAVSGSPAAWRAISSSVVAYRPGPGRPWQGRSQSGNVVWQAPCARRNRLRRPRHDALTTAHRRPPPLPVCAGTGGHWPSRSDGQCPDVTTPACLRTPGVAPRSGAGHHDPAARSSNRL